MPQQQTTQTIKISECGVGWSERCSRAKNPSCHCSCRGRNHGIPAKVRENNPSVQATGVELPEFIPEYVGKIVGIRRGGRAIVYYDGHFLDLAPSLEIVNHSPTGFNWGYAGSGCSQLALAICLKYISQAEALMCYQQFKINVIQGLPEEFELDLQEIKIHLNKLAS